VAASTSGLTEQLTVTASKVDSVNRGTAPEHAVQNAVADRKFYDFDLNWSVRELPLNQLPSKTHRNYVARPITHRIAEKNSNGKPAEKSAASLHRSAARSLAARKWAPKSVPVVSYQWFGLDHTLAHSSLRLSWGGFATCRSQTTFEVGRLKTCPTVGQCVIEAQWFKSSRLLLTHFAKARSNPSRRQGSENVRRHCTASGFARRYQYFRLFRR
jgi:hypothetical protein